MKIAIYARKSKLTEKGDSINNQISMCKNYAKLHFNNCNFIIYKDEGFSGGNTKRPMFKKLMKDINIKKFEVLICYRLDRISRNVNDFSNTLKLLDYNNISFVSINEQFDTSTPMGKAMISIASVFAELERDTTAQRITDNFTELAKTGRYLVGRPPEGLKTKKLLGKNNKYYNILEVVPEEAEKIKFIYKKYIELQSLTQVQKYCIMNNIKTKRGNIIKSDRIRAILTHEIYATADKYTYEYFKKLGTKIVASKEKFDGIHGITVFRRTKAFHGRHNAKNDPENIIIGVGLHEGIIKSKDWIKTQQIIKSHKNKFSRNATGSHGILNGILRCGSCGNYMRPVCIKNNTFRYACVTKNDTSSKLCQMKSVKHTIDNDIIKIITKVFINKSIYNKILIEKQKEFCNKKNLLEEEQNKIKKQIYENKKIIDSLISKLSQVSSQTLILAIEKQVDIVDKENLKLKERLTNLKLQYKNNKSIQINQQYIINAFNELNSKSFFDIQNTLIKRNIIKLIIKQIIWNGKEFYIEFLT